MRKINAINTKKQRLWSQLEQIYFMTEFKNPNKTDLKMYESIFEKGKLFFLGATVCLDWIQNFGLQGWKLRSQKLTLPLINNAEINANFYNSR